MTSEERTAVLQVLGQVHISDVAEEDLKAKEVVKVKQLEVKGHTREPFDGVKGCVMVRLLAVIWRNLIV